MKKIALAAIAFFSLGISAPVFSAALVETTGGPDTARTVFDVHGGILTGGGVTAPGFDLGIAGRILDNAPLYLGAQFGAFISASSPSFVEIPLLAELYYQFTPSSGIHPLLGAMVGPILSTGGGLSTAQFGFLLRPGFNFELGHAAVLSLEAPFGVIGSDFVVIPQIGAIFRL
jgi:hypothetical protein